MKWWNWVLIAGILFIIAQFAVMLSNRGTQEVSSPGTPHNGLQSWEWGQ